MDIEIINKNNIKLICKKGCCTCCSDYFVTAKTEFFAIVKYLEQNNISLDKIISDSKYIKIYVQGAVRRYL